MPGDVACADAVMVIASGSRESESGTAAAYIITQSGRGRHSFRAGGWVVNRTFA